LSGEEPRVLAEEHAALRRVATLVARGVPPEEVFSAVLDAVGRLLPIELATLCRYGSDKTLTFLAAWGLPAQPFPVGTRQSLGGENLGTLVFETGRPARIDRYAETSSGPLGAGVREAGIRSSVATPIMVEGRLWGLIAAGSTQQQPLPEDTEARLGSFTELVATAIANAESRGELGRLVEEQAALRRVATLVARGAPQQELFAAVTNEVLRLVGADNAALSRYEDDRTMLTLAIAGRVGDLLHAGVRWPLGGENVSTLVFDTGRPARVDGYADATDRLGVALRERGLRSAVGTPITVEGRLWGVMSVSTDTVQPLPADTEERLASFTALIATSIANAESRAGLRRLAEEQAALRRVATLVATGAQPEDVFAAAVKEVGQLLPVDFADLARYELDDTITMLATWGVTGAVLPSGTRLKLGGKNVSTLVAQTAAPARIDSYADASGPIGAAVREAGVRSVVGTPIIVDGRVWGTVAAGSSLQEPMPADTETRLASFTELVATAIANAESSAALAASRARIVAAADESRRRIERDLHDGGQQRLVHAVIVLKLALRALSSGEENAGQLVTEALRHAEQANSELRELAHGILPAALTRGGLEAGIEALVSRISLPVSVDVSPERLPDSVEATAYFVISEALTNVVKHARAAAATVTARVQNGQLRVEVCDDGVGGAQGAYGTGLGGLEDRVSALDGRLVVESPPGGGTRVCAELPVSDQR
jgi:signal transduction histidine kinase